MNEPEKLFCHLHPVLVQEFVRVEFPLGAKEPELGGGHNVPQGHQTVEQHSHKLQDLCFKSDDLAPIKTDNNTKCNNLDDHDKDEGDHEEES